MTTPKDPRPALLVVAGEASGDAMAARVVRRLGVPTAGMGGRALESAGTELWFDLVKTSSMGFWAPVSRLPALARAYRGLLDKSRAHGMQAALLVGFSEFNARLGVALRKRGVRVLWYAPPQVWAWRPARAHRLKRAGDRLALLFPFERAAWKRAGADADLVGHPALEVEWQGRDTLRHELGIPEDGPALALMPGSRGHEVRRMLPPFVDAARRLRQQHPNLQTRLLLSTASLSPDVVGWATRVVEHSGIGVEDGSRRLPAFDVALTTSGTATLECALAEVPPCIAYRTDRAAAYLARRMLRVDHIGLPNLLLGRGAFPELLQDAASGENLCLSANRLLCELASYRAMCREVRTVLGAGPRSPTEKVANLLEPWLN